MIERSFECQFNVRKYIGGLAIGQIKVVRSCGVDGMIMNVRCVSSLALGRCFRLLGLRSILFIGWWLVSSVVEYDRRQCQGLFRRTSVPLSSALSSSESTSFLDLSCTSNKEDS
jgi:hypothetical protein